MKYTILVLWTFLSFLLMFSSLPFRVECRPRGAMGPGPPAATSAAGTGGRGQRSAKGASTSSYSSPSPSSTSSVSSPSSSSSAAAAAALVASSARNSGSHSSSSLNGRSCPFLENIFSPWPDLYRPDITMKVWETTLVLEGTARSRSEVKPDGTFGVTFDLHRIVKGEAPLLRRRKQFRLQFLDNPNSYPSNNNNNNNNNNVNVNIHSNLVHSNSSLSSSPPNNPHPRKNHSNRIMRQQQLQQRQQQQQQQQQHRHHPILHDHTRRNSSSSSYSRAMQFLPSNNNNKNPRSAAGKSSMTPRGGNKCVPPKATVKTGRKYFVFAIKWENHFVAVFSPELANKKNTKLVDNVLCRECRQAPSVGATKEMVLKPKDRIRIRCRLRAGNPVPVLTWYKDGKPVNLADSRYRLRAKRRQSILVIRKTRETDVGEYKCEAKNYLGSAHAITRVVLAKKTSPSNTPSKPAIKSPLSSSSSPSKPIGTTPTTLWPLPSTACPFDSYCLNGGTCSYYETIGEFVCQCAEGYKGQRCDTKDISTSGSMYLSYFCIFGSINPPYPCS